MKTAFYAGSFDPFTNGHLEVVIKASKVFDKVIVAMGINPNKSRRFDKDLMLKAIKRAMYRAGVMNVEVIYYENLSVDTALQHGATYLIRGIRNGMDYEYEENLASINEEISGIDTIYFRAGKFGNVSSSMVMELLRYGRDVSKYLPEDVLELVYNEKKS